MAPEELLAAGREEVRAHAGQITAGKAISAGKGPDGFTVLLQDGRMMEARRLLIASGFEDELPEVTGIKERWGRDVLHCPYCPGWEIRHQAIGVLGTAPDAVLASGRTVPCEALVVSPQARIRSALVESLGLQEGSPDAAGQHLDTDPSGLTAVPGVWAAGNVTDPLGVPSSIPP